MKNVVIYHYYKADEFHFRNLNYFLDNGRLPDLEIYIFYASPVEDLRNRFKDVHFFPVKNYDYDFSGYSAGAKLISNFSDIKYVFFMNSGVIGPVIPEYTKDWCQPFTTLLNSETRLVGTTIASPIQGEVNINYLQSVYPRKGVNIAHHVQSMFFCITFDTLLSLVSEGIFDGDYSNDKQSLVHNFELLLSWKLLANGFNISSVLSLFQNTDYRELASSNNSFNKEGDPYVENGYFGKSINPYDVIFYKSSRNLIPEFELNQWLKLNVISTRHGQNPKPRKNFLHNSKRLLKKFSEVVFSFGKN